MNDLPVSLHVPQGADRHGVEPFAETRTARAVIEHNSGPEPLAGPRGDMVVFDLEAPGNYVAVRPSGTEPKVKFYMFAHEPPAASQNLPATKSAQSARLAAMETDLKAFAGV